MGPKRRNPAAVALARLAAKGRKQIPPEQRSEIARNAAKARWAKANKNLTDKEIAGALGISEERLDAAFLEVGLHPQPEKAEGGRTRMEKAAASAKVRSKRAKAKGG